MAMIQVGRLPMSVTLPLAVLAGTVIPVQGRINGALGARLGDGVSAAVVSFSTGLAVMVVVSLLLPQGRAGLKRMVAVFKGRALSPVYLTAGFLGAAFVFVQSSTVALLGIAVFTVAAVAGQSLSGILVDRWGIGPAGKKRATAARILGALLTLLAVMWAVSPHFAPAGEAGFQPWIVVFPVLAGALMSVQQAMNGTATARYGTVITTTLIHFVAGTGILWLAWLVRAAVAGAGRPLPEQWWYYLGGPAGCLYIGLGSLVVHRLGVLVTGLAMVSGQLFGSLGLDLLLPAPGTAVAMPTVFGTVLALCSVVLASVPWRKSALSWPVVSVEEKLSGAAGRRRR